MTQHTQGPWTLLPDPNGWTLHANGQDITAEAFDAIDADARLISAAPDLLAALLDVLDADGDLDVMDFNRYRAAVEKATGGAA